MPNTGSVTPPAHSPPLASTSYAHPSPGAGTSAERDPFLGAAARIPLTEEERQEGYDVELLNARPRGRYSADAASDDSLSRGEKYGGAGLGPVAPHPGGAPGALPPPLAPTGSAGLPAGAYGVGLAGAALGVSGAGAAERPGGAGGKEYGGAMEHSSGTTARSGKRKPWFLRPLPLGILAAFIIAVALAVGLGVGLSTRHSNKMSDDDSLGSNSTRISRSSTSRTRTATVSTGTVVPSSLYSSYTVDHPQSEETTTTAPSTTDDSPSTTTVLLPTLTWTSIPTATGLATTGNIPIPAASVATVNGTVYSAITSATETAASTATARVRWARQRWFFSWSFPSLSTTSMGYCAVHSLSGGNPPYPF